MSALQPFTEAFPPELIAKVISYVDEEDHLALKLTCKLLKSHLPVPFAEEMRKKWTNQNYDHEFHLSRQYLSSYWEQADSMSARKATILAHARLEVSHVRTEPSNDLICTTCGTYKPRNSFEDGLVSFMLWNPSRTWEVYRICIPCGMEDPTVRYAEQRSLDVNGQEVFLCGGCRAVLPPEKRVSFHADKDCEALLMRVHGEDVLQNMCLQCADERSIKYRPETNGEKGFVKTLAVFWN